MTIAIVTGVYPPLIGGTGAVVHDLAVHAPNQIAVITGEQDDKGNPIARGKSQKPQPERVFQIPRLSRRLSWPRRGKLRGLSQAAYDRFLVHPEAKRNLLRVLESLQPEAVCVGTFGSCDWVVRAVREWRPDIKVLAYVHGEEIPSLHGGYENNLRLRALKEVDALVAVSSFTKQTLVNIGVSPERIVVINNGVDINRFQPGTKNQDIIDRCGLANRRVLLTLARLDERKGQDMLIRALPMIRAAVPDVTYLVVGEGGYGPTLRRLVSELQLNDAVVFTGAVADTEVADYYQTCDLYAMPNRTIGNGDTEGFGLVFLEAGACGKPVIGGIAGGVPDAIMHQKTGLLVDGTSIDAIANSCIRLLQDDALRNELGANGLEHARKNEWGVKAKQFLALCRTPNLQ